MWAKESAVRGAKRLQSFRETQPPDHHRQLAHAQWSPDEGEIRSKREYWEGKQKAAEVAKEKGFRGFAVVPHPYRPTEEAKKEFQLADPDTGIWVWLRETKRDLYQWIKWSPHYHIIGATSREMDPAEESDDGVYHWIRSLERYDGKHDKESHDDVYGLFRYLLSHTGYPDGSTKQVTTWYGDLANSVFVEDAREEWQIEKPSDGVRAVLEREIREVADAGPTEDGDGESGGESDDKEECPADGCDGELIDVFDVSAYLRHRDPPRDVRRQMELARDWRVGDREPPPGLKRPQTEEQAREAWDELRERDGAYQANKE